MRRSVWLAFVVLCLLSSASWLISPFVSDDLPALERQSLLYGAVGLAGILFAARRARTRRRGLPWGWLVVGGVGFFGMPSLFFAWAAESVSGISRSVGFAMVPIIVVLLVASLGRDEGGVRRLLAPALVGLSGVLLLLPFGIPASVWGRLLLGGLVAIVVLVAIFNVWIHKLLQGFALADAVAVVCLSNAMFLLICGSFSESFAWRWSALASVASMPSLADGVGVVLILWLLRELAPVRFAARYLVIPLFTVLEGYVVMRPDLTVRMGFGVVLLAVGAAMILFSKDRDEAALSLR